MSLQALCTIQLKQGSKLLSASAGLHPPKLGFCLSMLFCKDLASGSRSCKQIKPDAEWSSMQKAISKT